MLVSLRSFFLFVASGAVISSVAASPSPNLIIKNGIHHSTRRSVSSSIHRFDTDNGDDSNNQPANFSQITVQMLDDIDQIALTAVAANYLDIMDALLPLVLPVTNGENNGNGNTKRDGSSSSPSITGNATVALSTISSSFQNFTLNVGLGNGSIADLTNLVPQLQSALEQMGYNFGDDN